MPNNFILKKSSDNGKLLTLLTNRERARSVPNLRNDWPGKIAPNFASTARLVQTSGDKNHSESIRLSKRGKQKIILTRDLPSVRVSSNGNNLQLKPCFSSHHQVSSFRRSLSSRKTNTRMSSRKSGVFKIQQNQDAKSVVSIFRNSKIANKVSEIIDLELENALNERKFQENWEKVLKKKSLIKVKVAQEKKQVELEEKSKNLIINQSVQGGKFKIDFWSLGYIDKVIDNPELWSKYVHKIESKAISTQEKEKEGVYLTRV